VTKATATGRKENTMRRRLFRLGKALAAAGTLGVVITATTQTAHAGIALNHCEPVLRAPQN
jgi:hypothetical protein